MVTGQADRPADSFGTRSRARAPVLLCYATFVFCGVSAAVGAVLLPAQMSDYGVDRAMIGIMFFTGGAGFVLASVSNGALTHWFGFRTALAMGGGPYLLAALYLATRPPFPAFIAVQLVIGYAGGVLESVLNTYLAALPSATTLLNRLHAFFGVGALLGPVLAAWIVGFTSWTVVWLVLAVLSAALVAGFLMVFPRAVPAEPGSRGPDPRAHVTGTPSSPARSLLTAALRDRGVLYGAAMLAVYLGVELSVGNWGFSYLVQARGLTGTLAGLSVSGYWLGLTAGRFLISPAAARTGLTTAGMIYACLAGITAATTFAWLSPGAAGASAALVLLGFFLGPVFPTTIAIVPRITTPRLAATAIGVLNAGSVVGGTGLPWLAGLIAQGTGIWTLLPFTLALALLQFAVWRPLAARIRPSAERSATLA